MPNVHNRQRLGRPLLQALRGEVGDDVVIGTRVLRCSGARLPVAQVLGALIFWMVQGFGAQVSAQINMPDPSLIHGKALPAPELPSGTVTVRVVREAIGNNIADQDVRVTVGGMTRTARTDDQGR